MLLMLLPLLMFLLLVVMVMIRTLPEREKNLHQQK
jgi:hypothetical protein